MTLCTLLAVKFFTSVKWKAKFTDVAQQFAAHKDGIAFDLQLHASTGVAAANAARTRRGGLGNSALQMLAEGGSVDHESDGDDTDIGDSPCPPPTKTVTYKVKKVGRLGRTETWDGVRIPVAH